MKKSFSLLEIIFVIIVIATLAGIALPRLTNTGADAKVAALKQDINTVVMSLKSYYVINSKIDKISDAVVINNSDWFITDKEIIFKEDAKECLSIKVDTTDIILSITPEVGIVCQKLSDSGISATTYKLN